MNEQSEPAITGANDANGAISKKQKYTPKPKSKYALGTNYIDGDRLHELLINRAETIKKAMNADGKVDWKSEYATIEPELALMFDAVIDNLMKSLNYKRYKGEWRESMKNTAMVYLIKYTIRYSTEKAKIRRLELNANRKNPLAPIPDGKIAFNYISWASNTAIFTTITKLKERNEKFEAVGLDENRMLSTGDVDEEMLNHYNMRSFEEYMFGEDEEGNAIDPIEEDAKVKRAESVAKYVESAMVAAKAYLIKHPTTKARRKLKEYMKVNWRIDLDSGMLIDDETMKMQKVGSN